MYAALANTNIAHTIGTRIAYKEFMQEDAQIRGGFITYVRVNKETLPDGWHAYDLREEHGDICELKDGYVWVNHYGTFCTQSVIPFADDEKSLYLDKDTQDFEYSFM